MNKHKIFKKLVGSYPYNFWYKGYLYYKDDLYAFQNWDLYMGGNVLALKLKSPHKFLSTYVYDDDIENINIISENQLVLINEKEIGPFQREYWKNLFLPKKAL